MTDDGNIATARAHSNIAFIKYWGNRDQALRLPANASLSMNLAALHTTTTLRWTPELENDRLSINGAAARGPAFARVQRHLDVLRRHLKVESRAAIESSNNFPMGAGIASSASAFAALTLAAVAASSLDLPQRELSILARLGSGSAARSIPPGFVEWHRGDSHESSYAETFAPVDHWRLVDVVAVVSRAHKSVGSTAGHAMADSSVLQAARVETAPDRLAAVKEAIAGRDFEAFAETVEADSNLMHAVMMTSQPPLFFWLPLSLRIMTAVRRWRLDEGIPVCYTLDAGPNVHCICEADSKDEVAARLKALSPEIDILRSGAGGGAVVLPGADADARACAGA